MSKKQSQQPLPAGMHIESGWSDLKNLKRFEEEKKKQQQDPRHNQE